MTELLEELWERTFFFLDHISLVHIGRVSRLFHALMHKNEILVLRRNGPVFHQELCPKGLAYVISKCGKQIKSGGEDSWPGPSNTVPITGFENKAKRVVFGKVELLSLLQNNTPTEKEQNQSVTIETPVDPPSSAVNQYPRKYNIGTYFALCVWWNAEDFDNENQQDRVQVLPSSRIRQEVAFYFGDGDVHSLGYHVYQNWREELLTRSFMHGDILGVEVGIRDFAAEPHLWKEYTPKQREPNKQIDMKKMYYVRTFRNGEQTTPLLAFPDIPIEATVSIGFSLKGRETVSIVPIPENLAHLF